MSEKPVVVVGVDGSEGSAKAAEWAEQYVRRCGGILRIVEAWQYPTAYGYEMVDPQRHPEQAAQQNAEKTATELSSFSASTGDSAVTSKDCAFVSPYFRSQPVAVPLVLNVRTDV